MRPPMLSGHAMRSLARALRRWPAARGRGLDPRLRERVVLHVSSVNTCPVCSAVHQVTGQRAGLSDADIAAARSLALDGWDRRTRAALRYAELRTLGCERKHPDALADLIRLFDPAERVAIAATVDLFTFTNRFNNTWERWLPGAASRRRRLGILR